MNVDRGGGKEETKICSRIELWGVKEVVKAGGKEGKGTLQFVERKGRSS